MHGEQDRWVCEVCGKRYAVPILARDCEDKHLDEKLEQARQQG